MSDLKNHAMPKSWNPRALLLLALCLLAFALRAAHADLMEFKHDEAVAWLRATALARGVEFPWAGLVSSKGLENFPLFLYLLGGLCRVFHAPDRLIWPIALLNSLAIVPIYWGVRILFDGKVAWITALLYAVSPCAILMSRKLWAQDLLPFLVSAMFFLAVVLVSGPPAKKGMASALFALLAVTSCQIHFSALFLLAAYAVIFALNRAAFRVRAMMSGAAIGLLPALPYVFFQVGHRADGFAALREKAGGFSRFHPKELLNYFLRQPVDEGFYGLLGPDYRSFASAIKGYSGLRYLLSFLVLTGVVIAAIRFVKADHEARRRYSFILILIMLPLALLGLSRIPLIPSYFLIFYPMPFLLAALALSEGCGWLQRKIYLGDANLFLGILLSIIMVYQVLYVVRFNGKIGVDGGGHGDYGATYSATLADARDWLSRGQPPEALPVEDLNRLALVVYCHLEGTEVSFPKRQAPSQGPINNSYRKFITAPLTPLERGEAMDARRLALKMMAKTN